MSGLLDLLHYLNIFGAGLALLMGVAQYLVRPKPDSMGYANLLLLAGVWQFGLGAWHLNGVLASHTLLVCTLVAMALCAPLLYEVMIGLVEREHAKPLSRKHYLSAVFILILLWWWPAASDYSAAFFLANSLFAIYCALTLYHLKHLLQTDKDTHQHMRHFFVFLILAGFAILFEALNSLSNAIFLNASTNLLAVLSDAVVGVLMVYLFLIERRYPGLGEVIFQESKRKRYSHIKSADMAALKVKLALCLDEQKNYRDHNLKLPELAEKLEVTTHQLSQYINEHLEINFSTLINQYRIADAKKLLRADKKLSVLAVGLEVGYKSSSAFHAAFKKAEGCSPGEFRSRDH